MLFVAAEKPEIVGFTAYTAGFQDVVELLNRIKKELECITLIGGPHVSCLPLQIPASADIGVIGEGEETLKELLELYFEDGNFTPEKLKNIDGIVFRDFARGYARYIIKIS